MTQIKQIIKKITADEHDPTSEIKYVLETYLEDKIGQNPEVILNTLWIEIKDL